MRARLLLTAALLAPALHAQHITIDASAPITAPGPTSYRGGTAKNPQGETIGLNARYLTLNGKPWLPVMGEFHYSRFTADRWEEQLLKMKAGGIDIVSTYVFWIHHEEVEGQWDWTGDRDLRRFVELCKKHHLYVIVRIGPWAHGEARNGGLPDWLLAKTQHTRRNDPVYLDAVDKFYGQIGERLHGLFWKDGGPIIGVQIENEYSARGEGAGEQHLLTLKQLALKHGFDVPLYTITGWNNAVFPKGEFLQVFGGYPDAPWDDTLKDLPPQEVYAFRFGSRVSGNMGAIGASTAAAAQKPATYDFPFMTAEVGGGIEDTYHRRPVIAPDDVAAMMPVLLGSGANLYGTYMFQGGINPDGKLTTLQESLATHYPNDLPIKDYDFQAPLSANGDETELFRKLKVYNEFLHTFGEQLAPMPAFAPDKLPTSPTDLSVPRVALRTDGRSGFLFFNNYARGTSMPPRHDTQVAIKFSDRTFNLPLQPFTLGETYGVFPVSLNLSGVLLDEATALPFLHIQNGNTDTWYFEELPGISATFSFHTPGGPYTPKPSRKPFLTSASSSSEHKTYFVLLSQQDAENAWPVHAADGDHILFTTAQFFADDSNVYFEAPGTSLSYTLIPGPANARGPNAAKLRENFSVESKINPFYLPKITAAPMHAAGEAPPVRSVTIPGRHPRIVAAYPDADALKTAATWKLTFAPHSWDGLTNDLAHASPNGELHDLRLTTRYHGDVAQLSSGEHLLDDNLYNGQPWRLNLARWQADIAKHPLELTILPLRKDAPVYLEHDARPTAAQTISLDSVTVEPIYLLRLDLHTLGQPTK